MRTEIDNHLHLARLLGNRPNAESLPSLLLWADMNPWDETSLWENIENAFPPRDVELSTWMYRSEFEDVALNLMNITPNPITVQVRPENTIAEHISVREAIQVPRYDGSWVLDALSELNAAHTIQLAPGEIRQLWFVCDSRNLDAGMHDLPIELLVLGHENTTFNATIQIEVEDIDLATTPPFMRCNWSSAARLRGQGLDDHRIERYIESGMNVLYLSIPGRQCDEQGQLIGSPDWSATDRELAMMRPDCFFFISINIQTPKGVKEGDPIWSKAYRAWADDVTEHLASKGFPISQWAVYPVDEPGLYDGPRIQALMEKVIPIKAAAPDVPIYANPSSEVTVENFSEMAQYIDVWCPELGVLLRRPELVDFFLQDKSKRV
ncbi:MAG: hypothetical protein GY847_11795, partial [Proteobacteria bacterium]|nr:hypothetical protein [Pseudomonadota bacterium]